MRIKILSVALMGVCLCAAASHAAAIYGGLHGAYVAGGDVSDESAGYGLHAGVSLASWNLEVSGTLMEDDSASADVSDFDLGSLSIALLYRKPLGENVAVYLGPGVSYNRFNFNTDTELDVQDDDQIGFLLQGGVSAELFDWLRIFADLSYNFVSYEIQADSVESRDEDYDFFMARIGAGLAL